MDNPIDTKDYYDALWRQERFSQKGLTDEERLRADAIQRYIKKYVIPARGPQAPLLLLDAGCGRGWLTDILASYGAVMGIDLTVLRAKELFPQYEFRNASPQDLLPEAAMRFHAIVATEVIEHLQDTQKKQFLQSLYALSAERGFVILTSPRKELWKGWSATHCDMIQPVEEWITEKDLAAISREAGFTIVTRGRIFIPFSVFNLLSRITSSRYAQFLMHRYPRSELLAWLRDSSSIYQIIVLQKI